MGAMTFMTAEGSLPPSPPLTEYRLFSVTSDAPDDQTCLCRPSGRTGAGFLSGSARRFSPRSLRKRRLFAILVVRNLLQSRGLQHAAEKAAGTGGAKMFRYTITEEEYLEMLGSFYGEAAAKEVSESVVKISLISRDGTKETLRFPLVQLLCGNF